MKKINNNDIIDSVLSSNISWDEVVRQKISQDILVEKAVQQKKSQNAVIDDFNALPRKFVFSKLATYKAFSRNSKQESFINGIQADAFIGLENYCRERLLNKEISSFANDDYFVEFYKAEIPLNEVNEEL